ncbi:cat eye syndrome critical region protein 2 [Trichonephila clavipes]|nr:cat eye syndrome critical region protein 2 [Trichonephila clavipes]
MGSNRCMNIDEKSRWSVVCHIFDDWIDFAAKFQDSTLECEQALFHTLKEDFLPVLNDIYEEKGRRLQEKLHKLMANSETTKMQTRKQKNKSNAVNGHNSDDSAHREYLARNRADRLEKRNRLNEKEEMHLERTCISTVTESWDELQIRIYPEKNKMIENVLSVLKEVKKSKEAKEFLLPVDEREVPDYYNKITEPICLSDITSKLVRGCYPSVKDVNDDFEKMVSNCCKFNGKSHELVQDAKNLLQLFHGLTKFIPQHEIPSNHNPKTADAQKPLVPQSCKRKYEQNTEHGRKKKKNANLEAVERSQSIDEDQFHNLKHQTENSSGSSGLKILPIHNHPSSLIEKFKSDASNEKMEKSKSCSKNLRTSNNEELIYDRSNVFEKHNEVTNFTRESDIPNAFSNNEFVESARSPSSRDFNYSRHYESSFVSSEPAEKNTHHSYNSSGFSSLSSSDNEFPTSDASCLGFVSSNTHFKKPQHENVPVSCSLATDSYNTDKCLNNHKSASLNHVTAIATESNKEISNNQSRDSSRYSHQVAQNQWKNSKNQLRNPFIIPPQMMKNILLNVQPLKSPPSYPVNPLNQNQEMLNSESYQSIYSDIATTASNEVMNDGKSAKNYLSDNFAGTNLEKKHTNSVKDQYSNCEKSTNQGSGNMLKSPVFPLHREVLNQEINIDHSRS